MKKFKSKIKHLKKKSDEKAFISHRFSLTNVIVFSIIFAGIAGYIILRSFAATPTTANLWIDTNGGSCTYSSTPVAYSDANACGTFDAAWDKASTGNTIVVKTGIYVPQKVNDGAPSATPPKTAETKFIGEGDGDDVIIRNNDTECEPIYGANSSFCAQAPYMTLENMVLDTANVFGANSAIRIWNDSSDGHTPFYNAHHVTLRNVDFWGTYPNMQVLTSDFRWLGGSHGKDGVANTPICAGGSEPVWLADGADRTIIDGVRFNPKIIQESGCDPHIETIRLQGDPDDVTIKNSWFLSGGGACSGHIFTGAGTTSNNVRIINNVFEKPCNNNPMHQASGTCDWYWAYNTFYQGGVDSGCNGTNNSVWIGNIGPSAHCAGTHFNNVWGGAANGTACGGADKVVTNLGLSASGGHLQAGSGAIDAITNSTAASFCTTADNPSTLTVEGLGGKDFEGTNRPQGAACDAGADEFGAPASSANFFIATSGNDANACTQSAPCRTFNRGYHVAQPGYIVEVAAGSYGGETITSDSSKTSQADVIFRPAAGASVNITGNIEMQGDHIEFRDMGIDQINFPVQADDVTLRNIVNHGMWMQGASNISIIGGEITCPTCASHPHIQNSGTTPPRNILWDGVYFHDWASQADEHVECLQLLGGDGITVRNSTFKNCGTANNTASLHLQAYGSPILKNILLENNFFYKSGNMYVIQGEDFENFDMRYNSIAGPILLYNGPSAGTGMDFVGNILGNSNCNAQDNAAAINWQYNVMQGGTCGSTDTNAASGFVSSSSDLHLTSGATAINFIPTGTGGPDTDFDGQARPQGSAFDAGADEFSGSTTPPPAPPPAPPGPPPPPSSQTPIAMYNFDEGTGTVANDSSTNNYDLTMPSGAWTTSGKNSKAANFNGSSFAQGPSNISIGSTGTIEAWVKLNTAGQWHGIVGKGSGNNDATHNYAMEVDNTNHLRCILGNNTTSIMAVSSGTLNAGTYYHLACSWNGTNLSAYINGGTPNNVGQSLTPASNSDPLYIGQYASGVDPANAAIDDLRIYNKALTQSEIQGDSAVAVGSSSGTPKQGDLNNDGLVNIFDLSILLTDYGKTKAAASNPACDINNDNNINIFDMSILLSKYGT